MLNYRDYGILLQMEKYCQRINEKVKDVDFETFMLNEDLKEIVCFNLLQIGELAKNLTDEFLKSHSRMAWKQIKGMRDKVAHGYGTLDWDLIFKTSKEDVPDLWKYCEEIITTEEVKK